MMQKEYAPTSRGRGWVSLSQDLANGAYGVTVAHSAGGDLGDGRYPPATGRGAIGD
jgi:hypothetical protein